MKDCGSLDLGSIPSGCTFSMKHVLPALVILYSFSLVSDLGSFWWVFDLASHWRAHYVLAGLFLVIAADYFKLWKWAVVAGVISIVHLIPLAAYLNLFAQSPKVYAVQDGQDVTVAYMNTYWLQSNMDQVLSSTKEINADIIFMEEIQPEQYEVVKKALPEYGFSYHESVAWAFDMAVFSKLPIADIKAHYFVPNVPTLEATVIVGDQEVHFWGVHPYSPVSEEFTTGRNELLTKLFTYLNEQEQTTVLGGDMNITQFSPVFREVTKDTKLVDTQRSFKLENTWPTYLPEVFAIPIDQVFVSKNIEVLERYKGPASGSDHWPLVVKLRI